MLDSSGTTTYCYDNRGNVVSKQQVIAGHAHTIAYTYNLADRLLQVGYPDGTSVSYSFPHQ